MLIAWRLRLTARARTRLGAQCRQRGFHARGLVRRAGLDEGAVRCLCCSLEKLGVVLRDDGVAVLVLLGARRAVCILDRNRRAFRRAETDSDETDALLAGALRFGDD